MAKSNRKSGASSPPPPNVGPTDGTPQKPAPRRGITNGPAKSTPEPFASSGRTDAAPRPGETGAPDALRIVQEQFRAALEELGGLLKGLRADVASAVAEVNELRDRLKRVDAELREQHEGQSRSCAAISEMLTGSVAEVRQRSEEVGPRKTRAAGTSEPVRNPEPVSTQPEQVAVDPEVKKNRFGATVAPGVVVAEVVSGGPAAAGGLVRGDVIEAVDNRVIQAGDDLREALQGEAGRDHVTLHLRRGSERHVRTVPIGSEGGTNEPGSHFGLTVASIVLVEEVFAGSPAEAAGLAQGDIIEDAHGQPVQTCTQLLAVIQKQPAGSDVVLVVTRDGVRHELVARLDRE